MTLDEMDVDLLCVNTIRTLSIDCIAEANSGHPGAPLGAAPMAYALCTTRPTPPGPTETVSCSRQAMHRPCYTACCT